MSLWFPKILRHVVSSKQECANFCSKFFVGKPMLLNRVITRTKAYSFKELCFFPDINFKRDDFQTEGFYLFLLLQKADFLNRKAFFFDDQSVKAGHQSHSSTGLTTSPRGLHFSSGPQLHTPVLYNTQLYYFIINFRLKIVEGDN